VSKYFDRCNKRQIATATMTLNFIAREAAVKSRLYVCIVNGLRAFADLCGLLLNIMNVNDRFGSAAHSTYT